MSSELPARTLTIDFSKVRDHRQHKSGRLREDKNKVDMRPVGPDGKLLTPKQIRARARRRAKRAEMMSDLEFETAYKPIEEWDLEELARGRPRNMNGNFRGATPKWVNREVHERAMDLFKQAIKSEMNAATPKAMDAILHMIQNEEVDEKGKPIVPASTKLDAAKFLLEHIVGKPTQRVENDISVKLQAILGSVMVNPAEALGNGDGPYQIGHLPGHTFALGSAGDDVVDGEIIDDDDDYNEGY